MADHLGENEELSFAELAAKCQVPEPDFTRILRQAMSKHIFKEPRKGFVAHTAASKLFISPSSLNDFVFIALEDVWPSATRMLDAMEKWDFTQGAHRTVSQFLSAYGSGLLNYTGF